MSHTCDHVATTNNIVTINGMQLKEVKVLFAEQQARAASLEEQSMTLSEKLAEAHDAAVLQHASLDRMTVLAAGAAMESRTAQARVLAHAVAMRQLLAQVGFRTERSSRGCDVIAASDMQRRADMYVWQSVFDLCCIASQFWCP